MRGPDTIRFETIAGLGPGGGTVEQGEGYGPPEPAAPPEPEQWAGPSQEEWERTQALLEQQQQQISQYDQIFNPPMPPGVERTQFDPYSEDPDTMLRQVIREEMAPFANYAEQYELQQTEEQARDIISAIASERGHELHDGLGDLIIAQSAAYAPAVAAQYGSGPQALEVALSAAYDDVFGALDAYAQAQAKREQQHLSTLSGAPREPSYSGTPAGQQVATPETPPGSPGSAISRGLGAVTQKYVGSLHGQ